MTPMVLGIVIAAAALVAVLLVVMVVLALKGADFFNAIAGVSSSREHKGSDDMRSVSEVKPGSSNENGTGANRDYGFGGDDRDFGWGN